jgi:WD40 repeat protein
MKKFLSFLVAAVLGCSILGVHAETLVALMSDKKLRYFDPSSSNGQTWLKTVDITGIPDTESVEALDFRPDGPLVVISREGNTLRPYTVDTNTGAATASGVVFNAPSANVVAFDATPAGWHIENLVLITESNVMFRFYYRGTLNTKETKSIFYDNDATDGDRADEHAGASPLIVALGSTNCYPGAYSGVLYGIDSTQNSLVKIDWKTGSIDTVAVLHFSDKSTLPVGTRVGFDISAVTGVAYLATENGTATGLSTVDLNTGEVVGGFGIGTVPQPGEPVVKDISTLPPTSVVNLATRSRVGTGDDVMIAGFIAQGGVSARLLIRGIGPSLTAAGVPNSLADPVLTIFDGNGVQIATNDNWTSDQRSDITATGLAPKNDLEAAYVAWFPPGSYTAILTGKNGGTGVGLVEVYKLPDT